MRGTDFVTAVIAAVFGMAVACQPARAKDMQEWVVFTGTALGDDVAIEAAIEDLEEDGAPFGLSFRKSVEAPSSGNVIVVGDAARNPAGEALLKQAGLDMTGVSDPQGYEIRTRPQQGGRLIAIAGGSILGDAYGLYWLWDRMRVYGEIPDLDVVRMPAVPVRLTEASAVEDVRNALRYGATWVSGGLLDNLMPWSSEPEATRNAETRAELAKLIDVAHAHHLKYLATGDEFSYHPSLLEEFNATLDPRDPNFWKALQAKYRRLFEVFPELDGVRIRTGEHTRITGSYRGLDVMHEPAECDWPLEKRYRVFVQKMHEVIVGEFDKIYFHRTWVTNTTEQHANPDVYRAIFTDEVPMKNLYLSPYLSAGDRWYYQPYNATFNVTPHHMAVLLSRLDYHAAGVFEIFPSFPGQYYQGGLDVIMASENSNVKGFHVNTSDPRRWDTQTLTTYMGFRLAWDPKLDLRTAAEDYAAIHLGREAAPEMADILLLSYVAYKDGIYIKPVAESLTWNTLPHLRCGVFEVRGYPFIDHGRAHIEWLECSMYAPSKGRIDEALALLERGRDAAREMQRRYAPVAPKVADAALAKRVGSSLEVTRWLVETNYSYVETCYRYFQYRENPSSETKELLATALESLKKARATFAATPDFKFSMFGVDQLIASADEAVEDIDAAEARLAKALDTPSVLEAIQTQQQRNADTLEALSGEAAKFLHWRGKVDGKDILSVQGDTISVHHLQDDGMHSVQYEFLGRLPAREVTVLVKDIESAGRFTPSLWSSRWRDNDYTFRLFIADRSRGYS